MKRPKCQLCLRGTGEEHFCFGCQSYVCHSCDKTLCTGKHKPKDHLRVSHGEYHGT